MKLPPLRTGMLVAVLTQSAWLTTPAWGADDLATRQRVDEAMTLQRKGRDDLAADLWRKLLILDPAQGEALVNLGLIEARAGHSPEAQGLLARAHRLAHRPAGLGRLEAALHADAAAEPPARAALPEQAAPPERAERTTRSRRSGKSAAPTPEGAASDTVQAQAPKHKHRKHKDKATSSPEESRVAEPARPPTVGRGTTSVPTSPANAGPQTTATATATTAAPGPRAVAPAPAAAPAPEPAADTPALPKPRPTKALPFLPPPV